jgi:hypothetical protein
MHRQSNTKRNPAHRSREAISNAHLGVELLDAVALLLDYSAEGRRLLLQPGDLGGELIRITALGGVL